MLNFNLNSILTFIEVANAESFTVASERLHTSSSAVSARIKLLEKRLGVQLFDRTTRSVKLTHAGKRLLVAAENARSELLTATRMLQREAGLHSGEIALAFMPSLVDSNFMHAISAFMAEYPNLALKLFDIDSKRSLEKLATAELDLAVISKPAETHKVSYEPLFWDRCIVALPKGHPLSTQRVVDIKALAKEPVIVSPQGTTFRHVIDSQLREHDVILNVAQEISTVPAMLQMVEMGFGISIVPARVRKHIRSPDILFRPIQEDIGWSIGVATSTLFAETSACKALREFLFRYYCG